MTPGRTGIKISIGLQCLAVAVIYVLVNYLGFSHYERRDYSRSQKFTLAEQTKVILGEFKQPLSIIVVSSPSFLSPVSQILGDVRSLMTEILFHKRQGLVVEYVDPTRNPSRIQAIQTKYSLTNLDNVAILDYEGRQRVVNLAEMGEFDMSPLAQGEAPILLGFRGEQILTSGLMSLLKPGTQNIYFLQGHGEPSPDISGDLSTWIDAIHRQNATCIPLSLSSIDKVPDDAAAVRGFARLLRPGGLAVVTVPAGMALWSDWDVVLHHQRRYSRQALCALFGPGDWEILHVNHTNVFAYPAVWLLRRWRGWRGSSRADGKRAEDRLPPRWLNVLLRAAFVGAGLSRIPFPFGVSLLLAARRRG
jgi:SAM-dependent methyltransferase